MASPRKSPRDISLGVKARAAIDKPPAKKTPIKRKASAKKTPRKKTPAKKKAAPKSTKKTILDMPLDSDDELGIDDEGVGSTGDVFIDWKDEALNHALITAITDNSEIKQGLFPSPGGDTRKGTGKPKTDHQYAIAVAIFAEHDTYKEAFALAQKPAEKSVWTMKIKNRLRTYVSQTLTASPNTYVWSRMVKNCREHMETMGSTGSGLDGEDQITIDNKPDSIYTKWGLIKDACPWFFELKNLISERPSVVAAGLGNNASPYEVSILMPTRFDEAVDSNKQTGDGDSSDSGADEVEEIGMGGAIAISDEEEDVYGSPKVKGTRHTSQKRTAPKASISTPATAPPSKKAKGMTEKFVEIAMKEEETTQKLLDIKTKKVNNAADENITKLRIKGQVKLQRERLKAELKAKKQDQLFQLHMMRMGHQSGNHNPFAANMNVNNSNPPSFMSNGISSGVNLGWPVAGPSHSTPAPSSSFLADLANDDLDYDLSGFGDSGV